MKLALETARRICYSIARKDDRESHQGKSSDIYDGPQMCGVESVEREVTRMLDTKNFQK